MTEQQVTTEVSNTPTKNSQSKKSSTTKKWGLLLWLLVVIILLAVGYYYFRQHHTYYKKVQINNSTLAVDNQQRINQLAAQQQQIINQQQQLLSRLQQKGMNDEPFILDNVLFILQRADLQVQIEHNVPNTIKLLQVAYDNVENINSYQLNQVAEAITKDIDNLQQIQQINLEKLNAQFQAGHQLVDQLSFQLNQQMQTEVGGTTQYTGWEKAWHTFLQSLSKVIVVHRIDKDFQPLMNQNALNGVKLYLHTLLQQAFWGAVNHNDTIYHTNLHEIVATIQLTLPSNNSTAQQIIQLVNQLQQTSVQPTLPQQLPSLAVAERIQQQLLQPKQEVKQ